MLALIKMNLKKKSPQGVGQAFGTTAKMPLATVKMPYPISQCLIQALLRSASASAPLTVHLVMAHAFGPHRPGGRLE